MNAKVVSVAISQNGRYLLVNKIDGEARMLDLDSRGETVRVFASEEPGGNWIIKAAYGGANESFVIIGSESKSKSPGLDSNLLTKSSRWQYQHLAQRIRKPSREAAAWKVILQRDLLVSYRSVNVRLCGR